jgi:hypothetical protein
MLEFELARRRMGARTNHRTLRERPCSKLGGAPRDICERGGAGRSFVKVADRDPPAFEQLFTTLEVPAPLSRVDWPAAAGHRPLQNRLEMVDGATEVCQGPSVLKAAHRQSDLFRRVADIGDNTAAGALGCSSGRAAGVNHESRNAN